MDLWNVKNLPAPPRNTYKSENRSIDLPALRATISNAILVLTKPAVTKEAALLSRCIYRMKKKFRNDKGFKCMEKMNRALLQMLRLRFTDTLKTYLETIPNQYDADAYLPTLNMLQYILVRLQGLSKLLVRLCDVTRCAARFMQERIYIAHMWKVAFIIFSMIARIYALGKELLKFCCEFYEHLLVYCPKFRNVGADWLPSNCILPTDLRQWLDIDWLDQEGEVIVMKEEVVATNIPMFDDSDSDVSIVEDGIDSDFNVVESLKNPQPPPSSKRKSFDHLSLDQQVLVKRVKSSKRPQVNKTVKKKLSYSISYSNEEDVGEPVKRLSSKSKSKKKLNYVTLLNR